MKRKDRSAGLLFRQAPVLLLVWSLISVLHASAARNEKDLHPPRENCRLLGIIEPHPIETEAVFELLDAFRFTSHPQRAGWSISIFSNYDAGGHLAVPGEPMIIRSERPVEDDEYIYLASARLATRSAPDIVLGHLRNASSGCVDVADPHPFHRIVNNHHILFIHNGAVWGEDLETLINTLFSNVNPTACPDMPVDSEYLFLYLIKLMKLKENPMPDILMKWIMDIRKHLTNNWNALNAIITDGATLWAIRYSYRPDNFFLRIKPMDRGGYALSTEMLGTGWTDMPNHVVIEIRSGSAPVFKQIPPSRP